MIRRLTPKSKPSAMHVRNLRTSSSKTAKSTRAANLVQCVSQPFIGHELAEYISAILVTMQPQLNSTTNFCTEKWPSQCFSARFQSSPFFETKHSKFLPSGPQKPTAPRIKE